MLKESKSIFTVFFDDYKENLLTDWVELAIRNNKDLPKGEISRITEAILALMIKSFHVTDAELMDLICQYATDIAKESAGTDLNIGEFTYNVNIGRTIFYKYLMKTSLDAEKQQEYFVKINYLFDKFLFFAISYFSETKNKIIEEKTSLINSTHQDRLTLLGQMTSSFIHEFRNPLTSIQGFIQLLKADYPEMKYLNIISSELDQLNFRISQFLLLSKKELIGKEKVVFDLNQLIEEVLNFLYPSILDGKVKVIKNLTTRLSLFGYPDEIRQVLINIIFNAIDVFGHQPNDNPTVEINSYMIENTHIIIDIANNGPMIPGELRAMIFEPFFTTKKLGTGLGLFVCKEIIEKHNGELFCNSSPQKTTFTIKMPIAGETEE